MPTFKLVSFIARPFKRLGIQSELIVTISHDDKLQSFDVFPLFKNTPIDLTIIFIDSNFYHPKTDSIENTPLLNLVLVHLS